MNAMQWVRYSSATLVLFVFLSLPGCREKPSAAVERPTAVRVIRPVKRDMQERISYLGTWHAAREIQIIAQVQGTVQELPVPEGGRIQVGDLLLRLDAPDLQAAVDRLRVERDYWERRSAADRRLAEQNALPAEQVETSLRAFGSADAAYREALSRLDRTADHSPVVGQVFKWLVEPGQHVMPGQPMLLIGGNRVEIQVEVIDDDLQRGIRPKTLAEYEDLAGKRHRAAVSEVAVRAEGASRTFTIKIHPLEADAGEIRLGAAVPVDFVLREARGVLALPLGALAGDESIFVIRDDCAWKQPVRTGIEEAGMIEVEFAWNGEDRVAISDLNALRDGVPVYAVSAEEVQP